MDILSVIAEKAYAAAPAITPIGNPGVGGSATLTIGQIFYNLLSFLLFIAGILAVFYLVWAGLQYVTSAGDPGKTKTARQGIVNAIIGIIIIVSTFTIIRFAQAIGSALVEGGAVSSESSGSSWLSEWINGMAGEAGATPEYPPAITLYPEIPTTSSPETPSPDPGSTYR